jgi:hypothetical protein
METSVPEDLLQSMHIVRHIDVEVFVLADNRLADSLWANLTCDREAAFLEA